MGGRANPELVKRYREFSDELKDTTAGAAAARRADQGGPGPLSRAAAPADEAGGARRSRTTLQKKADQVAQDYLRVGPNDLSPRADQPLEQAKSELREPQERAEGRRTSTSRPRRPQRAVRQSEELARAGEQQRAAGRGVPEPAGRAAASRAGWRSGWRRTQRRCATSARSCISSSLRRAPARPGRTGRSSRSSARVSGSSEQRAQELQQKMDEMEQMAPLFGEEGEEQMQQVGRAHGRGHRADGRQGPAAAAMASRRRRWIGSSSSSSRCSRASAAAGRAACRCPMLAGGEQEGGNEPAGRRWRSRTRTLPGRPGVPQGPAGRDEAGRAGASTATR